jgi:hypothetical protein
MKNSKTGFSFVIIIALIAFIMTASYVWVNRANLNSIIGMQPTTKKFTHPKLMYEFSYPASWKLNVQNDTIVLVNKDSSLTINIRYTSKGAMNREGIVYCAASRDVSRCESREINNNQVSFDWGGEIASAIATIPHPDGGRIDITIEPNSSQGKKALLDLLDTFTFL